MNRIKLHAMVVIGCAVVMSLLGGSSRASCPTPPPGPICTAKAAFFCSNAITTSCRFEVPADCPGGTCTIAIIDGTVDGNGASVTSIVPTGGNLTFSSSGTPAPTATFRIRQSNTALPATGNVTANASGSCTIPVSFTLRTAGAPNETICTDGIYTFTVKPSPSMFSAPAGTNACARHIYNCATDGAAPAGEDFPSDTHVFSVASPIHSPTPTDPDKVRMELTMSGTWDAHLRLAFARSTDGVNYLAFNDVTTGMDSGDLRIIGTGDWSIRRVAAAVSPVNFPGVVFPSMSVWGRVLLALLMLAAVIWFSWRYATTSRQVSRHP